MCSFDLASRAVRGAVDRQGRETSARLTALLVLRELAPLAVGDAQALGDSALRYRADRGGAALCGPVVGGVYPVAAGSLGGGRSLVAGRDSLAVFDESAPPSGAWRALAIASVTAGRCASGAAADLLLPAGPSPGLPPGAPVLAFEPMELRGYVSDGAIWLGVRAVATAEGIQPVVGPLARAGFRVSVVGGSAPAVRVQLQPAGAPEPLELVVASRGGGR